MASGLKVRLDDGSEVGPLDLRMVQTWFEQGLISRDTMVQRPGVPRWVPLAEAADLSQWGGGGPRGRGAGHRPASGGRAEAATAGAGRFRLFLASALFLVLAVGAVLAAVWPDRVRPELDGAPWVQIALVQLALGLALVRGWELGRWAVRAVMLVAACAAFPLAGFFLAKGMRGEALLVVASAGLLAGGLFAFLAPDLSRLAAAACLLLILVGGGGLVRFGPAEASAAPAVTPWTAADRRVVDQEMGLTLEVPPGWVVLKAGNPLVPAPAACRITLAQPRVSGYAFLLFEPPPERVLLLEHYLDHVLAERQVNALSFDEERRRDSRLGSVEARRASSRRSSTEGRFIERTVVAQDGDRYFALVAWVPEAGGGRSLQEIDALESAVSLSGARGARRRDAVQRANLELPHLGVRAIQNIVESGGPAEPAELFRRSLVASARGLAFLGPSAAQELRLLTTAALGTLPKKEGAQLADYLGRVAAGQPTLPQEDEPMRVLMKAATTRLDATQRARLEELHDSAVHAAIGGS